MQTRVDQYEVTRSRIESRAFQHCLVTRHYHSIRILHKRAKVSVSVSSCSVDAFASWSCSCLQTALDFDLSRIHHWFGMMILQRYILFTKEHLSLPHPRVLWNWTRNCRKNVCNAFIIVVIGIYLSQGVLALAFVQFIAFVLVSKAKAISFRLRRSLRKRMVLFATSRSQGRQSDTHLCTYSSFIHSYACLSQRR